MNYLNCNRSVFGEPTKPNYIILSIFVKINRFSTILQSMISPSRQATATPFSDSIPILVATGWGARCPLKGDGLPTQITPLPFSENY
jgi:hypothetical protein